MVIRDARRYVAKRVIKGLFPVAHVLDTCELRDCTSMWNSRRAAVQSLGILFSPLSRRVFGALPTWTQYKTCFRGI